MMDRRTIIGISVAIRIAFASPDATNTDMRYMELDPLGRIPQVLVLGPITQEQHGFGWIKYSDTLETLAAAPQLGKSVETKLVQGGEVTWFYQSPDESGYTDLHQTLSWLPPGTDPERVWHAKAAYVRVILESQQAQSIDLLMGAADEHQVFLNGQEVFRHSQAQPAAADQNRITLDLQAGPNQLTLKIYQTHLSYGLSFFGPKPWHWGFYARLVDGEGEIPADVRIRIPRLDRSASFNMRSTPLFKTAQDGSLLQKTLIQVEHFRKTAATGTLIWGDRQSEVDIGSCSIGRSMHEVWLPAMQDGASFSALLRLENQKLHKDVVLEPQPLWELYYIPFSHQDIGYTHTQPITAEIHARNLDKVMVQLNLDPQFNWTIESLWELDQYRSRYGEGAYQEVLDSVRSGRIALSPAWSNPFTGMVSEGEAAANFHHARDLLAEGIEFNSLLYNDTPGMSWLWPSLLNELGTEVIFAGINEVYNDYSLQRNLPKIFNWEGSDGSQVITFLGETYNEGLAHGLEVGLAAMPHLINGQLEGLRLRGWPYDHVGLLASFLDNGGVPDTQLANIKAWNEEYAWPRFIVSTSAAYTEKLLKEDISELPVLNGDWTSPWETRSQGEVARMIQQRGTQGLVESAAKLSVANQLLLRSGAPALSPLQKSYSGLLDYSGHGSGLEAGYGSAEENALAANARQFYIDRAWQHAWDWAEREKYRLAEHEATFEQEGVLIFNPSAQPRDEVVTLGFRTDQDPAIGLVDIRTDQILTSAWQDPRTLIYVARDLAPMGYTKFALRKITESNQSLVAEVSWDPETRSISSAQYDIKVGTDVTRPFVHYRDKQLGDLTEILNEQMLVSRRPLIGESFERLNYESAEMEIIDHQPAGVLIRIQAPNWFIEWGFWAGIKGITTSVSYDLESLEETEELVEYGYALPKVAQGGLKAQIGGGWMDPEVDLLPGVPDYSLSLRQGLLLNLDEFQLGIASRDARVLYLENLKPDGLNPVLGLFNNFPLSWNRNEANDGWVTFHLNSQPLTKKSGVRDLTELTTSAAEPLILGHTWFRTKPASESVFELKGKGVSLLAVHPCTDGEGFLIRIQNHDPVKDLKAVLRSPFFNDRGQIYESSLKEERGQAVKVKGDSVRLKLGPREIRTLRMDWLQQEKGDD